MAIINVTLTGTNDDDGKVDILEVVRHLIEDEDWDADEVQRFVVEYGNDCHTFDEWSDAAFEWIDIQEGRKP